MSMQDKQAKLAAIKRVLDLQERKQLAQLSICVRKKRQQVEELEQLYAFQRDYTSKTANNQTTVQEIMMQRKLVLAITHAVHEKRRYLAGVEKELNKVMNTVLQTRSKTSALDKLDHRLLDEQQRSLRKLEQTETDEFVASVSHKVN